MDHQTSDLRYRSSFASPGFDNTIEYGAADPLSSEYFTQLGLLIAKALAVCCPVRFVVAAQPDTPFQYVFISSFSFDAREATAPPRGTFLPALVRHFQSPKFTYYYNTYTALQSRETSSSSTLLLQSNRTWGITESSADMLFTDNRLSCSLFARCSCPAVTGTFYCDFHLRRLVELTLHYSPGKAKHARPIKRHTLVISPQCELVLDRASPADLLALQTLRTMYRNPKKNWLIDFEFCTVKGLAPVIWSVSVRQINEKPLFYTTIRYANQLLADIKVTSSATSKTRITRTDTPGRKPLSRVPSSTIAAPTRIVLLLARHGARSKSSVTVGEVIA